MPSVLKTVSKFEFSHLFLRCWPVLASPTPGEQKPLTSVQHLNRNYQPKSSMYTSKTNLFSRRSQRKPLQAARMSFEPAKVIYVRFQPSSLIYFYSKYSRRNTLYVRVVKARRFNSGYTCCNLLFTLSAEPLIGLIDIGIQLEVIQDLPWSRIKNIPVITDEKSERYMLRYISISREKYNRHSFLFTGFGYKLVTDRTTYNFIHGISIIEQLQLFSLELKLHLF